MISNGIARRARFRTPRSYSIRWYDPSYQTQTANEARGMTWGKSKNRVSESGCNMKGRQRKKQDKEAKRRSKK